MEQSLKDLRVTSDDGENSICISYNSISREFTETDKNLILYSDISYTTNDFEWNATLATVKIPYRDPAVGFLLDGKVFSSVGIYQRAPGIVMGKDPKGAPGFEDLVDIITSRNSTVSIMYKLNGVQVRFHRGDKERFIPIGIFLKALFGIPYSILLDRMKFKPQMLLNSFPCQVPRHSVDLARTPSYGLDSLDEPCVEDCIDVVYSAMMQFVSKNTKYSSHWKYNRIRSYLESMHFKTEPNYEGVLSLHSRARGTTLDQDLDLAIYDENGNDTVVHFARGTFIDENIADFLRWHDVSTLRVHGGNSEGGSKRSYILQEDTPMLFRAVGYRIANEIKIEGETFYEGTLITKEVLKQLNSTHLCLLEVSTPTGHKTLTRSSHNPDVGDFITILNCLFTMPFRDSDESTQYEVANRIVIDYSKQVLLAVEQTYNDIVNALAGCQQPKKLMESLPKLPSTQLYMHLRDNGTKELSQPENVNVMARAIAERRASALIGSSPAAMTAVQKGQYGRIDSLHSPESNKIGAVQEVTAMAKLDPETGNLLTPYEKVVDGVPTGEIEYISAAKERNKYIVGWDNDLSTDTVFARFDGDVTTVETKRVNYRDASPFCDMSISRMTIPFPEFSQPRRSLMATRMSGQAVSLLYPERPYVSTGADTEIPCLYYTARQIVATSTGISEDAVTDILEVVNVKWTKESAIYDCVYQGKLFKFSIPVMPTDVNSLYYFNLNYKQDYKYSPDDIVFFNQNCDLNNYEYFERVNQGTLPLVKDYTRPSMALGVNLKVMVKTYRSSTVDDGVVISDSLILNQKFTSLQIMKYDYTLKPGEEFDDLEGIPKLHSQVYARQPVINIRKLSKGKHPSSMKQVLANQSGEVIYADIQTNTGEANVWIATFHDAVTGDKVAARHGNKAVIARIVPHYDMPYDPETGEIVDIILSPLGIPSRMNYGQVVELALAAAMDREGKHAVVTPFYPGIKGEVENLCNELGLAPKKLYNPVYGKFTERPVMVGSMYFLKLEQMANLKYKAVGYTTAVDPVFDQPVDSINTSKGQRIDEMTTWALHAAGADHILTSLFSWYSSDEVSRKRFFDMLAGNPDDGTVDSWSEDMEDVVTYQQDNKNAVVTQMIVRMFGLDIETDDDDNVYRMVPLNFDDIPITVSLFDLKNNKEPVKGNEWCKVKLLAPVVNPFWINNFPLHAVLGVKSLKILMSGTHYLDITTRQILTAKEVAEIESVSRSITDGKAKPTRLTGIEAVIALLRSTTINQALDMLMHTSNEELESNKAVEEILTPAQSILDEEGNVIDTVAEVSPNVADIIKFLTRMKSEGMELKDLVWDYIPVMPKVFRQSSRVFGRDYESSFQKQIVAVASAGKSEDAYKNLCKLIGVGASSKDDIVSIRNYFFGKDSASGNHGAVRSRVLAKRIGFSGRCVIIPASDSEMTPFFVGIPWRLAMIELSKVLAIRLIRRAQRMSDDLAGEIGTAGNVCGITLEEWEDLIVSLYEFNPYVFSKHFPSLSRSNQIYLYHYLRAVIKDLCEGDVSRDGRVKINNQWYDAESAPKTATINAAVVTIGRQPTLHAWSTRTFFMLLVDGDSLQIHHTVCGGFNADFDGDAMFHLQLFGEDKIEGMQTTSCMQDLISEKDGSFMLGLVQDTALGLYCATIFKDNASEFVANLGDYNYFDDIGSLKMELEYGTLHYYDAVLFYEKTVKAYYMSTAGRILVNSCVPGAFTKIPFSDRYGICAKTLGTEFAPSLCELRYDVVWVATNTKPVNSPETVKIESVLLDTYHSYGARKSVMTVQALYEVGLTASDIYSITASMDDMGVDLDVNAFMKEPQELVLKYNSLEQMGLISTQQRKDASARAWNRAYKKTTNAVLDAIPQNSNTHYLLYSGARGKVGQVMQAVGFIGTISKTSTTDIEYPILTSYGRGLSSLDLFQTCYMARIGVVSTQAGTQDTGYSTRQTVYMSSGLSVKEDDCGIQLRTIPVVYSTADTRIQRANGALEEVSSLLGESIDPGSQNANYWAFKDLSTALNRSGFLITEEVLELLLEYHFETIDLWGESVQIRYTLDADWKAEVIECGYSYALPYLNAWHITEESLDWVEQHGLSEIAGVLWDEDMVAEHGEFDIDKLLHCTAYLPVDYDRTSCSMQRNGVSYDEERLYGKPVSGDSEGFHYYCRLLGADNTMTVRALQYLLKKGIHMIQMEDGTVVSIKYKVSSLFRDLVVDRVSAGLPFLKGGVITDNTIKEVENVQLEYIPVRTSLTCLSEGGICSKCNGLMRSTGDFAKIGKNLGIPAAQAQCEPLSQSTLNVTHSGGKRSEGVGKLAGLSDYMRLLRGKLVSDDSAYLQEDFAKCAGYIHVNPHDNHFFEIVSADDGEVLDNIVLDDPDRLNVVDGAFVDIGDTIKMGIPRLDRYSSHDIFTSALKTRYMLLQEYYNIFKSLNVSPKNYERLARVQVSDCYLDVPSSLEPVKDTSRESLDNTGKYILRVSRQYEVVNKYSGIAGFAFENVAKMLSSGVLDTRGLPLNSVLGNFVTGTPVGERRVDFIPRKYGVNTSRYRKSALKRASENIKNLGEGKISWNLSLDAPEEQRVSDVEEQSSSLLDALREAESSLNGGDDVNTLRLDGVFQDHVDTEDLGFGFGSPDVGLLQLEDSTTPISGEIVMEIPADPEDDEEIIIVEEPSEPSTPSVFAGMEIIDASIVEDEEEKPANKGPKSDKGPGVGELRLD